MYATHIAELIHLFLTTRDNDIPQCGFDDIEDADASFLETVLLAELPPTPAKQVAALFVSETMHRPRSITVHSECYCARFLQPNSITESSCQRLQSMEHV
jgi:hypothetical protein